MNKYREAEISSILGEIDSLRKKDLVKDFIYKDLGGYVKNLSELAESITAYKRPLPGIERRFVYKTKNILDKGYELDKSIKDKVVSRKLKRMFRKLAGPYIFKSKLCNGGYNKPFGYPGDYKVIELVYNNRPISRGFGYYVDRYMLRDDYIEAVKDRKDKMREILKNFLENYKVNKKEKIKILNIACGSSRELRELIPELSAKNRVVFTLIDQEASALKFSKKDLLRVSSSNESIRFRFIRDNVISLIAHRNYGKTYQGLRNQDFVYSIGLVDYLPDPYFEKMIKFSFDILKKDCNFVFAHKDVVKYPSLASDWICDWNFVTRSMGQVLKIAKAALKGCRYDIKVKENGNKRIYFVFITKR